MGAVEENQPEYAAAPETTSGSGVVPEPKLQRALTLAVTRAAGYHAALASILRKICRTRAWAYGEAWMASRGGAILKPGPVWPTSEPAYARFRARGRKLGFRRGRGLPGRVLRTGAPEWMEDSSRDLFGRRTLARAAGLHAAVGVPVSNHREVLAVLVFFSDRVRPPEPEEMDVLHQVVASLGPLLERKRIEEELRVRARRQEAVARLGLEALNEEARIDLLLRGAVRLVTRDLDLECAEVFELASGRDALVPRASIGWDERPEASLSVGGVDSPAGYTLMTKEPLLIDDLERESRFAVPQWLKERDLASGLVVVIPGHRRPVGVLSVYATRRRRFTPTDVSFLQGVANVLGSAIERNRAEAELERHRRHLEQLVEERTAKLEAYHEQLRQADRLASIGTLAAGLGHDMNNVLLPVLCRLDALEQAQLPEGALKDVRGIRQALDYLRQLSHGLRLFALDPEDADASNAETRLYEWWDEVGPLLKKSLPKGVAFQLDFPDGLPAVQVAGHRLSQAVLNLLVNAGEATGGEGRVKLWARRTHGRAVVRLGVTDDGHGMSGDVLQHALEPFFTTKKRKLSTGLGLSLVHGAVTAAGGSVKLDSTPGVGTTVVLELPAVVGPRVGAPRVARTATVSLDDPRTAAIVCTLLKAAGFEVLRAPDGPPGEALLWVTTPQNGFPDMSSRFLGADLNRRVVVLGKSPDGTSHPRVAFVERGVDLEGSHELEGLRQALRATVHDLVESTDVF